MIPVVREVTWGKGGDESDDECDSTGDAALSGCSDGSGVSGGSRLLLRRKRLLRVVRPACGGR